MCINTHAGAVGAAAAFLTVLLYVLCSTSCSFCSSAPPRSVKASDSPGLLQCQQLVLAANPKADVLLNPSTYGYQGCSCGAGFKAATTTQEGVVTNLRCVESQVGVKKLWRGGGFTRLRAGLDKGFGGWGLACVGDSA